MYDNMDYGTCGFAIGGGVMLILALTISQIKSCEPRDHFEAEAVKHNAATWTVDENGNRVFKWKGE